MIVNVHEAKTRPSQLLAAAELGEDVAISRNGVPVVRLVPIAAHDRLSKPGAWRSEPGWEDYEFEPPVLAPLQTDEELAEEGWPT